MTTFQAERGQTGLIYQTQTLKSLTVPSIPRVGESEVGLLRLIEAAYLNNPWRMCRMAMWRHQRRKGRLTSSHRYLFEVKYYELSMLGRTIKKAACLSVAGSWLEFSSLNKHKIKWIKKQFKLQTGFHLSGLEEVLDDQHERYIRGDFLIRASYSQRQSFHWRTPGYLNRINRSYKGEYAKRMLKSKRSE